MRQANFTFSSLTAPNLDTATGYVDFAQIKKGHCVLLSLFGYNSGAQQWLHLFDTAKGSPSGTLSTDEDPSALFTSVGHGLLLGDAIVVQGITGVSSPQLWFVRPAGVNAFSLHPTLADALANTNAETPDDALDSGTYDLVPIHTLAIGAADNYSAIVPVSGINFSRGLLAAVSTSAVLYTAGAKEVTMLATLLG